MGSSKNSSERGKEHESRRKRHHEDWSDEEKEKDKSYSRGSKKRDRSRDRDRDRDRDRGGGRSREKERDRDERDKSRERDSSRRESDRSKRKEDGDQRDKERRRRRHGSPSDEEDPHKSHKRRDYESSRRGDKDSSRHEERTSRDEQHLQSHSHSPQSDTDEEYPTARKRRRKEKESAEVKRKEKEGSSEAGDGPLLKGSGETLSLSIEETNKLRAKLGLKPLQVDDQGDSQQQEEGEKTRVADEISTGITQDIHVPAKNISDAKTAEKLREKMETLKEKRRLVKKLGAVKGLGEESDSEESTSEWVQKLKQRQREKEIAEKKAKMLEEMDEEFGVGSLISETLQEEKQQSYASKHLKGLKVQHKAQDFHSGRQVVLTLEDANILDEGEDVLVNVTMVDQEKADKNVENRKGKPGYNPYEEEEDEFGDVKPPPILKKYNEEIEGEKKESFSLGEAGEFDTAEQREREIVRQKLRARGITLDSAPSQLASEYYTSEEMVSFRKPRKKKKVRKRLKADDLLPLPDARDRGSRDHGSRKHEDGEESAEMEVDVSSHDSTIDDLKDEVDSKVDSALQRTRRLLSRGKAGVSGAAKVATMLESVPEVKEEPLDEISGDMVLNATAEFCRQVGEEEEEERERLKPVHYEEEQEEDMETEAAPQESIGGWTEVKPDSEKPAIPGEEDLYQEAEPIVASGIIATLQMATKKGFIAASKSKSGSGGKGQGDAQRDRDYERQRERERERDLSRYDRDASFPEKKGYKPNVKIEYVDDSGRLLNTKEAFRFMSHKFHGRGSGKKKIEKRLKKIQDEEFMKKSSSVDTPLNTLAMLQTKQKASQAAYIVLSGGSQSMLAPDIAKKK